jgi:general stress protein 26
MIGNLWNPMLKTWFTEGEDDPRITFVIRTSVKPRRIRLHQVKRFNSRTCASPLRASLSIFSALISL